MVPVIHAVEAQNEPQNTPSLKRIRSKQIIEESYAPYLTDESRYPEGAADELIFAHSEKQVIQVVKEAFESEIPITVSAGRTGIVGGAVPLGGILLSLEGLNQFLGAKWDNENDCWNVRVQSGVSLKKLQEMLDSRDFSDALPMMNVEQRKSVKQFSNESDGWFYPPDPTEKSAHIGGTVATNASGARSFKYGNTRNFVVALKIVLENGILARLQRGQSKTLSDRNFVVQSPNKIIEVPVPNYTQPKVKNTAGYYVSRPMDFIDLFIGSEGTLGIITEIEIKLRKKPDFILGGISFFPSESDAINFVKMVKETVNHQDRRISPTALEYFDSYSLQLLREESRSDRVSLNIPPFPDNALGAVYFEQEGRNEDVSVFFSEYEKILSECHTSMDNTWGALEKEELDRMLEFRHAVPEIINTMIGQRQKLYPDLHKISTDIAVPDNALNKMLSIYHSGLDKSGLEFFIFGHIGENHLHVNVVPKNRDELNHAKEITTEFAKQAVSLGGTICGEHGIGKIKKPLFQLVYSANIINEMKRIKNALDSKNVLGPGTLF